MSEFIVRDDFWELFPETKIGIIICNDIKNQYNHDEEKYATLLKEYGKEGLRYLSLPDFSQNDVVRVWREAYKKFKTKKGARSSIEALLKRINKGDEIRTINPLVDLYNAISLKYALPCGGEDIDKFEGDVLLTKAKGNEDFVTLGSNEAESPYEGEIVYKDDKGVICRCWNWREAVRTMLTEDTQHAFLCIECVDMARVHDFEEALKELAELVQTNLDGHTKIEIMDKDHTHIVIK